MNNQNNWFNKANFYEIYPQTFKDSNGDGIGDLNGIIEKLDYIKEIGFNALWLNPIFDSPFFDAGYDVRDFYKVAPRYGTNEDLYRLFEEAHKRGIKVILDLVPGHTSIDHEWFKESCKAEKNEYSDRYIWTKSIWENTEDVACIRGFYERDGSVATNFFSIQPALNYGFLTTKHDYEDEVGSAATLKTMKAMSDVISFYLEKGCDGFRVDMAGWIVKRDDEEFSGTIKAWDIILKPIKEKYPNAFFVSEWSSPKHSLLAPFDSDFLLQDPWKPLHIYMCRGDEPFFRKNVVKSAHPFFEFYTDLIRFAKEKNKFVSIISGNHDTIRIKDWLNDDELGLFYIFMYTMPGMPFMYYGDEIGMTYNKKLKSVEGGYHRTGSRTPMQWDESVSAGFSTSTNTYTCVNHDYLTINVQKELQDENSLLHLVKRLLSLRKDEVSLDNDAEIIVINDDEKKHLHYARIKNQERVDIYINASTSEMKVDLKKSEKVIFKYHTSSSASLPSLSAIITKQKI